VSTPRFNFSLASVSNMICFAIFFKFDNLII
jgi:hypothetical protein